MPATPARPSLTDVDFAIAPFIVIWEMTQACQLACLHCRASARPFRDAAELSTGEAMQLLDDIRAMGRPLVVLTGGDPLERPDVVRIVEYGTSLGLRVALTPSGTPRMTEDVLAELRDAGLARLAVRGSARVVSRRMNVLACAGYRSSAIGVGTTASSARCRGAPRCSTDQPGGSLAGKLSSDVSSTTSRRGDGGMFDRESRSGMVPPVTGIVLPSEVCRRAQGGNRSNPSRMRLEER